MTSLTCLRAAFVAALFAAALPATAQERALAACVREELGAADCGVIAVQSRRLSSRPILLDVIVLRATGAERAPDPLFVLQGGPGQAATSQADFYARTFAAVRARRDIWLVDVRGTGRSDSLHCSVGTQAAPDFLPIEAVRACRTELERRGVNLSSYTTRQIVADLEDVRRRFRLRVVNLYGTSYGTRVALEYMRLYPRSVRTAALSGVVPAQSDAPTDYGRFAQQAFERYAALCGADRACAASRPDPAGDLARAQARVAAAFASGESSLSPGLFGELVRMELYGPARVGALFAALRQAAQGDLGFWQARAQRLAGFWSPELLSLGQFLSVTCADFMPAVDIVRARQSGLGTFAGSYRAEQQAAACAVWGVPPAARDFRRPVRSRVPALLVSGELDPVTPPAWAALAARTLPNGRAVVIRNNGHAMGAAAPCVAAMMTELIETRSARGVDTSCADDLPPPDFSAG
jgi:pimeloyl-ACP methyl ester carboxylesterase